MGLFDQGSDGFDPRTQGLLAAAFQGLQASGPSRMPVSLGQIIGQAGGAGMEQYNAAQKALLAKKIAEVQMRLHGAQASQAENELASTRSLSGGGGMLGAPQMPTGVVNAAAPPQAAAAPIGAPQTASNRTPQQQLADRMRDQAKTLIDTLAANPQARASKAGMELQGQASKLIEEATKLDPSETFSHQAGIGPDGKASFGLFGNRGGYKPMQGLTPLPKNEAVDLGGTKSIIDMNAVRPGVTPTGAVLQKTATPGELLTNARAKEAALGADVQLSPQAITNAAARYNVDGTLPPLGLGKAGAKMRQQILDEAGVAAGKTGISGTDQRVNQLANKANSAALNKLTTQETMVGAFEKNFVKNADIALEYSTKTDKTGVPIVNSWINAGKRAVTGDAQLAAYDAVIKSTVNEYTKIISGSMGNMQIAEGEIKKVENLLTAAQTPEQVKEVINMMKRETQNRMKGFKEEKASLLKSMKNEAPPKYVLDATTATGDIRSKADAILSGQ